MNTPQVYVTLACLGFVSGVYVGWVPGSLCILAVFVAMLAVGVWGVTHKTHATVGVAVVGFLFLLGAQRFVNVDAQFRATRDELRAVSSSKVWHGVVVTDRDEREKDAQVDVRLVSAQSEESVPHTFTHAPVVRLTVPLHTSVGYADRVEVHGAVTFPKTFTEEDGRTFDYGSYLRAQGVVAEMRYVSTRTSCLEDVRMANESQKVSRTNGLAERSEGNRATRFSEAERLENGSTRSGGPSGEILFGDELCVKKYTEILFSFLYDIKMRFKTALQNVVHEPYAALALGLVVGEKHGLTKEEMNAFTATGLSHIVVLSGFNITIIIVLAFRLLSFLPRRSTYIVGMLLALLFVAMTGFSSTAVRALCMAFIVVVGKMLYRSSVPLVSLVVVSLGMVAWNPYILRDDVSFHLSFLATLGIILFGTRATDWWSSRVGSGAGEVLGVTFAASVFTIPYIAYTFGQMSLIAPIANLLVLPLVQPAMGLAALAGGVGMVPLALCYWVSFVLGVGAQAILAVMFFFVEMLSRVPYAAVSTSVPLFVVGTWFLGAGLYAYTLAKHDDALDAEKNEHRFM